jgi:inosine/xanthosine triphosphatase
MNVNIGSKNPQKIEAAKEALQEYPEFSKAEVKGIEVNSEVSNQPKSMDETFAGAINRARNAFNNCDYSIGLESGLIAVPNTKSGYMDITACAIYDGNKFHLGGSSVFEYPKSVIDLVLEKGYEIDQAALESGFTTNPHVGKSEGMVGILTRGRLDRKGYTKQAVMTALIHLLNPNYY